jgi:hypothetical protein
VNQVLDLNNLNRPTLELTLLDPDRTKLRVGLPTEALVREMEEMGQDVGRITKGDKSSVDVIYDLLARCLSCNRDFIKVTAEDLRTKYGVDHEAAIIIYQAYNAFIEQVAAEKN